MSRPRLLATRVARRGHHALHALFCRPCERCGKPFDYCGSCQPGRKYCSKECSEAARAESKGRARAQYNDRGSEEGRKVHRLEEATRRALRAQERVGDHRCHEESGGVEEPALAACPAATEASDATFSSPMVVREIEPASELQEPALAAYPAAAKAGEIGPAPSGSKMAPKVATVEWVVVAWPGLLVAARKRLGTEATCPFCGRRGLIVRVVSIDEWRRRTRCSFG